MTHDCLRGSLLLALFCSPAIAAATPVPKQLSGPPEEFAAMRVPDPAAAAIHSKSALVPVELVADKSGGHGWQGRIPVENGRARLLVFAGQPGGWEVELGAPGAAPQKAAAIAVDSRRTRFGLDLEQHEADYFALDGVASGSWSIKLQAAPGAARRGYLLLEGDPATELASWQAHRRQRVGEQIGIVAMLTATDAGDGIELGSAAGHIERATLRVTDPAGKVRSYPMHDDGRHDDGKSGDGVYGARFAADSAGAWLAQVEVHGSNRAGAALLRTAEHVVPVVQSDIAIAAGKAAGTHRADGRMAIAIPVATAKSDRHYRVYAELWGRGAKGVETPVAWLSGMVEPVDGALELGFDERWLLLARSKGGYELRNLRIEDPDHFVSLAEAARLPLQLPAVRSKLAASAVVIDETMTMGPRPPRPPQAKGVGRRLILVHGYCSGGVWPTSQFSSASTFLDANQSRSNDQFARLLQSYGSTWNSFGTVAHSQGGMASLHLYTYYWSGLDYATGNRLIQSVGTPYRGTNLAGILATLGSWFGVGCGTQSNLTYSGAQSWLAGIPSWARAKVNYYTTAFRTTNWWTNDYCNFATDLVLSDPEDGTTEQVNGQLAGGINRGHTAGQCHTTGMRDMAQYLDGTRNATMNSNAAR